jgi:hypothetical protein
MRIESVKVATKIVPPLITKKEQVNDLLLCIKKAYSLKLSASVRLKNILEGIIG